MGHYDTRALPIYQYLHSKGAPHYVIADHFFQAAFGGSFLNHQYLIAARAPRWTPAAAPAARRPRCWTRNGMPNSLPALQADRHRVVDGQLTRACPNGAGRGLRAGLRHHRGQHRAAGQPAVRHRRRKIPLIDDAKYPNIGDRLSAAGVSWNWYSGGWDDAAAGHPGPLFQYHHQPFNYFADYAPGQPGRDAPAGRDSSSSPPRAAARCRPSASSSRTARRTSTPATPASRTAATTWSTCSRRSHRAAGQGHPGRRDLRRVRRPVGPRRPARAGHHAGASTTPGAPAPGSPRCWSRRRCKRRRSTTHVYDTTSIMATIEHSLHLTPVATRDARVADLGHAIAARPLALTTAQEGRGAYMITATPTRATRAPATS